MIRIIQQREKCIGCHACVEAARFRWRISKKDGKCTLIGSTAKKGWHMAFVEEDEYAENMLAAKNCPVKIIRIEKIEP
jgi:ferredoxin